jgi:hypothetical protein
LFAIPARHEVEYLVIGKEPSRKGKKKMREGDPTALCDEVELVRERGGVLAESISILS